MNVRKVSPSRIIRFSQLKRFIRRFTGTKSNQSVSPELAHPETTFGCCRSNESDVNMITEVNIIEEKVDYLKARKPGIAPRMWTPEEDKLLMMAVQKFGTKSWKRIAYEVPSRTHVQCLQRYQKVLRNDLVKGAWSEVEDELLLTLMAEQIKLDLEDHTFNNSKTELKTILSEGNKVFEWKTIADQIQGRSAKQCRERWYLNLDPKINRGEWNDVEDKRLLSIYQEIGSKWSSICKELPGRTENSVKTRFNSIMRREAKRRGWSSLDDTVFIHALLAYGKDFQKIGRLLLGRSKSQLRKRFNEMVLKDVSFSKHVNEIEVNGSVNSLPGYLHVHVIEEKLRTTFGVVWRITPSNPLYKSIDSIQQAVAFCFGIPAGRNNLNVLSLVNYLQTSSRDCSPFLDDQVSSQNYVSENHKYNQTPVLKKEYEQGTTFSSGNVVLQSFNIEDEILDITNTPEDEISSYLDSLSSDDVFSTSSGNTHEQNTKRRMSLAGSTVKMSKSQNEVRHRVESYISPSVSCNSADTGCSSNVTELNEETAKSLFFQQDQVDPLLNVQNLYSEGHFFDGLFSTTPFYSGYNTFNNAFSMYNNNNPYLTTTQQVYPNQFVSQVNKKGLYYNTPMNDMPQYDILQNDMTSQYF